MNPSLLAVLAGETFPTAQLGIDKKGFACNRVMTANFERGCTGGLHTGNTGQRPDLKQRSRGTDATFSASQGLTYFGRGSPSVGACRQTRSGPTPVALLRHRDTTNR